VTSGVGAHRPRGSDRPGPSAHRPRFGPLRRSFGSTDHSSGRYDGPSGRPTTVRAATTAKSAPGQPTVAARPSHRPHFRPPEQPEARAADVPARCPTLPARVQAVRRAQTRAGALPGRSGPGSGCTTSPNPGQTTSQPQRPTLPARVQAARRAQTRARQRHSSMSDPSGPGSGCTASPNPGRCFARPLELTSGGCIGGLRSRALVNQDCRRRGISRRRSRRCPPGARTGARRRSRHWSRSLPPNRARTSHRSRPRRRVDGSRGRARRSRDRGRRSGRDPIPKAPTRQVQTQVVNQPQVVLSRHLPACVPKPGLLQGGIDRRPRSVRSAPHRPETKAATRGTRGGRVVTGAEVEQEVDGQADQQAEEDQRQEPRQEIHGVVHARAYQEHWEPLPSSVRKRRYPSVFPVPLGRS
jgi:hypothetical protein